jgi:DNA-binding NtrC family response regulator
MSNLTSIRVLVVDDEPDAAEALTLLLKPRGYDVRVAGTGDAARSAVSSWRPHVVLLDLMLPDVNGLDLLRDFRAAAPETQVVMVTGYGSVPRVVEAMNDGAFGFIEKPIDAMLLLAVLDKAGERLALAAENRRLRSELHDHATLADMVARSDKMKQLFAMVRKVAPSDASVLIHGENGTGKELIASAIHQNSKRAKAPFIKINCSAIPSELIESELFGHKRGSFTGALADRPGVIELADGGSLLLDEIGEMPAALQAKLLRVLQEREFTPVGSTRPIKSDFRLICSTNVNLDVALSDKKLRQDLFFRINTFTLAIPPLRERTTDIPLLADYFLEKYTQRHQREVRGISPDAMRMLQRHRWPGNVRELEHALERAVIVATEDQIQPADLPSSLRDPEPSAELGDAIPAHHTLEEIERLAILRTLERTQWNKRATANILGVYRPTLYSKLKKYNLLKKPTPTGSSTN